MNPVADQVEAHLTPFADEEVLDVLQASRMNLSPRGFELHFSTERHGWHIYCVERIDAEMK